MRLWQPVPTDDPKYPSEFFHGQGAVPIINAQESWTWMFACDAAQDITEPIAARLKIFYGASNPVEANFRISAEKK
jgi:hypothetical protein